MANQIQIAGKTVRIGETVSVHYKLIEKEKVTGKAKREVKEEFRERTQIFEGIMICIKGAEDSRTFTVRRIAADNIGVERIFPVNSPWIKKVEVRKQAKVRRSKLYYLRGKVGKAAEKLKEKNVAGIGKAKKTKLTVKKDKPKASASDEAKK